MSPNFNDIEISISEIISLTITIGYFLTNSRAVYKMCTTYMFVYSFFFTNKWSKVKKIIFKNVISKLFLPKSNTTNYILYCTITKLLGFFFIRSRKLHFKDIVVLPTIYYFIYLFNINIFYIIYI